MGSQPFRGWPQSGPLFAAKQGGTAGIHPVPKWDGVFYLLEGTMLAKLDQIEQTALSSLSNVQKLDNLEGWRIAYLGRNSPLMRLFDQLGQLPKEQRPEIGRRANQVKKTLEAKFAEMGFQVYLSRDVETDEMNFQLLNFPPHHPAREMQDSFYIEGNYAADNPVILRTHTSPGQIRAMREFAASDPQKPPPVRIILPGMCYRYEQISARAELQAR